MAVQAVADERLTIDGDVQRAPDFGDLKRRRLACSKTIDVLIVPDEREHRDVARRLAANRARRRRLRRACRGCRAASRPRRRGRSDTASTTIRSIAGLPEVVVGVRSQFRAAISTCDLNGPVPTPAVPGFWIVRLERFEQERRRPAQADTESASRRARHDVCDVLERRPHESRQASAAGCSTTVGAVTRRAVVKLHARSQIERSATARPARRVQLSASHGRGRPSSPTVARGLRPTGSATTCRSPACRRRLARPARRRREASRRSSSATGPAPSAAPGRAEQHDQRSTPTHRDCDRRVTVVRAGGIIYRFLLHRRIVIDDDVAVAAGLRVDGGLLDNLDLHCSLLSTRWPRHAPAQ